MRTFQASAALQSRASSTINHRGRGRQSYSNENTKELLLDKLHVSHNESAGADNIRQAALPIRGIMNFAKLFVGIVRNQYSRTGNPVSISLESGKIFLIIVINIKQLTHTVLQRLTKVVRILGDKLS